MICRVCNEDKDVSEFHESCIRNHNYSCKQCHYIRTSANSVKRKLLDPEHYGDKKLKSNQEWRKSNPIRSWAWHTIDRHKRNKFDVKFTLDELCEFVKDITNCPYCGKEIDFLPYTDKDIGSRPTLDRIDNETSMTLENIQVLCHRCNTMKSDLPHREFITLLKRISDRCYHGN